MPRPLKSFGQPAHIPPAGLRMRALPPFWIVALVAMFALLGGDSADAGIGNTPLPVFSTLRPAVLVAIIPGVLSRNSVETFVMCTNVGSAPVDMGVELFDQTGTRANTIANGNGAATNVGAGGTITFATGATALVHEDVRVILEPPVLALQNGAGRVVASAPTVSCVAFAIDQLHDVRDPLKRPDMPPTLSQLDVITGFTTATSTSSTTTTSSSTSTSTSSSTTTSSSTSTSSTTSTSRTTSSSTSTSSSTTTSSSTSTSSSTTSSS